MIICQHQTYIGQAKCSSLENYTSLEALVVLFQNRLTFLPVNVGMGRESYGRRVMIVNDSLRFHLLSRRISTPSE